MAYQRGAQGFAWLSYAMVMTDDEATRIRRAVGGDDDRFGLWLLTTDRLFPILDRSTVLVPDQLMEQFRQRVATELSATQ